MKAVIFNSGYGKRMGEFTKTHHKSQAPLKNGETIYQRQLRLLMECGIKDFVITTGPHKEQLMNAAADERFKELNFTFVENPIYDKTNYIYSMFLAREYLDDDVLLMHGDLVFDKKLLQDVIASEEKNLGMLNRAKALPEKDFKARVEDGKIVEVSINIFDENCFAFQPLYKLSKETLSKWLERVGEFIEAGNDGVYAENALNEIAKNLDIKPFSYEEYYVDEVDNLDDLERVSSDIRQFDFDEQVIYSDSNSIVMLPQILNKEGAHKPMIVCDFYEFLSCREYIESLNYDFVLFKEFSPNPKYEQVAAGVKLFKEQGCDIIISIGGGSAIDTAKNIKLFSVLDEANGPFVKQEFVFSPIKHICIPGTAGTGSDSTRYSVVYYEGEKFSVTHDCIVPDYVILDTSLLETLPLFQKKCTVLDALSQCIEAIWSVNTNEKCRGYAIEGMRLIFKYMMPFLRNEKEALHYMQIAANLSGKAINISQTTAGHALSYKLTSLYNLPHGYSVALCLPKVWRYMNEVENARRAVEMEELSIDKHKFLPIRQSILNSDISADQIDGAIENAVNSQNSEEGGFKPVSEMNRREILVSAFEILKHEFGMPSTNKAIKQYEFIVKEVLELEAPTLADEKHLDILSDSVNPVRLGNNPEELSREAIYRIYQAVFGLIDEDENDAEDPAKEEKKTLKKKLAELKNRNKPVPKEWNRMKSEIKELQNYTLEILLQIDEFCKEHGITYYLSEGTLLGAVRHNGFIPWDDDVDIMMSRENYDKFINLGMQGVFPEGLALDCYENNNKHWVLAAKVQMKKPTKFVQEKTYGLTKYHGPYVDVFPLDYVPKPMSKKQLKQSKATRYVRRMLFIKTKYSLVMKAKPKRYILRAVLPFIPMKWIYKYLDKNLRMFETYKENGEIRQKKYLAHLTSYYPVTKETFPTSFFGKPRYVSFMGHMLPIPCEAEFMLKTIYGKNYDTIPPFKVLKSRKHAFVIHNENGDIIDDTLPDANAEDEISAYD
ncbi:MAG: iron-containing alcohol dehydrogenase [Eubacterium sp.]|nr:iron-containing alcohol dehydrogenase [Eubacterium sp.]